jgi:hypothetical protein
MKHSKEETLIPLGSVPYLTDKLKIGKTAINKTENLSKLRKVSYLPN